MRGEDEHFDFEFFSSVSEIKLLIGMSLEFDTFNLFFDIGIGLGNGIVLKLLSLSRIRLAVDSALLDELDFACKRESRRIISA